MSVRRISGEWVWLRAGSGFIVESNRLRAELQPEDLSDRTSCMLECGDPECREWATLWTESDPLNRFERQPLYHVSECEMFDGPQGPVVPPSTVVGGIRVGGDVQNASIKGVTKQC